MHLIQFLIALAAVIVFVGATSNQVASRFPKVNLVALGLALLTLAWLLSIVWIGGGTVVGGP